MEEGDTAILSDVKIEIDVAEETPQYWHMTEPQPYVPDREVNTATMPTVQSLVGKAAVNTATMPTVQSLGGKTAVNTATMTTVQSLDGKAAVNTATMTTVQSLDGKAAVNTATMPTVQSLDGKAAVNTATMPTVQSLDGKAAVNTTTMPTVQSLGGKAAVNTATMTTVQSLDGKAAVNGHSDAWLKPEIQTPEIQTTVDNCSHTWLKQEIQTLETQTAVNTHSNTWLNHEIQTPETRTAVDTHSDNWLKREIQTPETQTAVNTHSDTWLNHEIQTPEKQTAVDNFSDTWLKQEIQTPQTHTAVNTHSGTWLKQEIQTPETQTAVDTHNDIWLNQEIQTPKTQTARGKKRKTFTVQERLYAIGRCKNGDSRASICRDIGVPESTFRGWLASEDKLRSFVDKIDESVGLKRIRTTGACDKKLDDVVFQWFTQEREKGIPISGPIIKVQAEKLKNKLHGEEKASPVSGGWVNRFKNRHAIIASSFHGEEKSADMEAARRFPEELRKVLERHSLKAEQVYNADETGLYYKAIPRKTLAVKHDKTKHQGFKEKKEWLTLLVCTNATGSHKLKPFMIGKSRNPRCFHHVNMNNLPVRYRHSKNSWMTRALFSDWFFEDFVPAVRRHLRNQNMEEKAVLLLDNCPAHPPAETLRTKNGKIFVHYLPKNTTSKIQPMDQGVISTLKMNYRRELMLKILDEERDVMSGLKCITVKEAAFLAGKAWQDIRRESLMKIWNRALGSAFHSPQKTTETTPRDAAAVPDWPFRDDDDDDNEPFEGFSDEEARQAHAIYLQYCAREGIEPVNRWMEEVAEEEDRGDTAVQLNDDELVDAVRSDHTDADVVDRDTYHTCSTDSENSQDSLPQHRVTAREAVTCLETALRWFEGEDADIVQLYQLRNVLSTAKSTLIASSSRQTNISDFFGKEN